MTFALLSLSCCNLQSRSIPSGNDATIRGVMKFISVEGGCWYLETKDGKRYELVGEDLQHILVSDLNLEVRVRPLSGVSSICQVGEIVEVLSIHRIE